MVGGQTGVGDGEGMGCNKVNVGATVELVFQTIIVPKWLLLLYWGQENVWVVGL